MKASDLLDVDTDKTDYLMGLFGESHVEFDNERQQGRDPSLSDMTEKAMQVGLST